MCNAQCTVADGYKWRMRPSLRVDTLALPCNALVKMIGCPTRFTSTSIVGESARLQLMMESNSECSGCLADAPSIFRTFADFYLFTEYCVCPTLHFSNEL